MGARVPKGSLRQVRGAHERSINGLVQVGRAWKQHLIGWLKNTLGARIYMNDRYTFEWSFTYENDVGQTTTDRLTGTMHVGDVLLSAQSERVRAGFMRILKASFAVAGCENEDDEATEFTGTEIRRNWQRKTIALHQAQLFFVASCGVSGPTRPRQGPLDTTVAVRSSGSSGEGVWEEVLRPELPVGASVVPAQFLFTIKTNGDRTCSYVARGDLMQEGIHYIASRSSIAAIEAVRMQVALAAAEGWKLHTTDFSMAFTAAPVDEKDLYLELPPVPPEFEGAAEWGHGYQKDR